MSVTVSQFIRMNSSRKFWGFLSVLGFGSTSPGLATKKLRRSSKFPVLRAVWSDSAVYGTDFLLLTEFFKAFFSVIPSRCFSKIFSVSQFCCHRLRETELPFRPLCSQNRESLVPLNHPWRWISLLTQKAGLIPHPLLLCIGLSVRDC